MPTVNGAAALAATPALSATAQRIAVASATLHAPATFGASGATLALRASLGAAPALHAAATVTERAAGSLHASPQLTATPFTAAAAFSARGVLLVPGRLAASAFSAGTSLIAHGTRVLPGAAALRALGGLSAAARVTEPTSASLRAATSLSATAQHTARAAATLHAAPVLTAAPFTAVASLHAAPALTATPSITETARAALSAAAVLLAVPSPPAALTAYPFLTAHGTRGVLGGSHLSASPGLSASAHRNLATSASLTAHAALAATAFARPFGSASLFSSPALRAAGSRVLPGRAAFTAAAQLHATAGVTDRALAALRAPGVLTSGSSGTVHAVGALAAVPSLTAVPLAEIVTRASLAASAALAAAAGTAAGLVIPPVPPRLQPAWQRDVQAWGITHERQRHAQALWQYGELAVFALAWTTLDLASGLAQRCTRCFNPSSVAALFPAQTSAQAEQQIAAAYGQGNQYRCPLCYGTQMIAAGQSQIPGLRALIVRPGIFTDTDQNQQRTAKGTVNTGQVNIQSTPDFRVSTLDYCFRADGRRYQLRVPGRTTLRTGFGSPWQQATAVSYNLLRAGLEDPSSVAYIIPPDAAQLARVLGTYTRVPADYSWFEVVNAPLIPGEAPPPAASGRLQPTTALPPPG